MPINNAPPEVVNSVEDLLRQATETSQTPPPVVNEVNPDPIAGFVSPNAAPAPVQSTQANHEIQELKQQVAALTSQISAMGAATQAQPIAVSRSPQLTAEQLEAMGMTPEMANYVRDTVEQVANQRVKDAINPLQEQVTRSTKEQRKQLFDTAVMAVHPDTRSIISNPYFTQWVNQQTNSLTGVALSKDFSSAWERLDSSVVISIISAFKVQVEEHKARVAESDNQMEVVTVPKIASNVDAPSSQGQEISNPVSVDEIAEAGDKVVKGLMPLATYEDMVKRLKL